MNRLRIQLLIVCLALIALVPAAVSAQGATESAGSNVLTGTHWQLVAIDGKPALESTHVTLQFDDANASGNGGCNGYNGGYTVSGSSLTLEPLMMTRMACVDDLVTQQESDYIGLLQAAKSFEQGEDTLMITSADGKKLSFEADASDPLAGTQWQLVSYGAADKPTPLVEGSHITLGFDTMGYVYGTGGCNDIGGHYQVQGDKVAFSLITTEMACTDEAISHQESDFFGALSQPVPYIVDGDTLTLQYGDNQQLTFSKVALAGSSWQLMNYGAADAQIPAILDSEVTLTFNDDTQLSGNGGCNSFGGQYSTDGSNITISQVISTMKACLADNVIQQEQAFLGALQSATSYAIDGDTLTIDYPDGELTLSRLPSPEATPGATGEATEAGPVTISS